MSTSKYNSKDLATPNVKVPKVIFDFDTNNISELKYFLRSLHISFKSQTLENSRIISEMSEIKKRNDYLEAELLFMEEVKSECDKAKHNEIELSMRYTLLEEELARTNKTLKTLIDSGKEVQESSTDKSKDKDEDLIYKSKMKQKTVKTESPSLKTESRVKPIIFVNSTHEKGSSSKSKEPVSKPVSTNNAKKRNIGLLSQKQLRKKLGEITTKKLTPTDERNNNRKVGTIKKNNYKGVPKVSRKECVNCDNSNHLTNVCRKSKKKATANSKSGVRNTPVSYKSYHSCFYCGSKWHSIHKCEEYQNLFCNSCDFIPKLKSGKTSHESMKTEHAYSSSDTDKTNTNKSYSDSTSFVKKTSAVKNVKMRAKRTQQVWVLKNL